MFATLPLQIACHGHPKLANFLEGLAFRSSKFFTRKEIRILLKMKGSVRVMSSNKIESDLWELRCELRRPGSKMLKPHTLALIKAIEFWKLRFNVRYLEEVRYCYKGRGLKDRISDAGLAGTRTC
jgi:hypothetical protein